MKTFNDLTKHQQDMAVFFAYRKLYESIKSGVIEAEILEEHRMYDLAVDAAEGSQYNDEGNAVMEEMDVPYYFQGGCV
jgi:hypothetical protein